MFLNKRYAEASVAFLKAGRNREAAISDAYLLREKALSISTTAGAARIQAFIIAANAFSKCAEDFPSKQVNERRTYYRIAGECYSETHNLKNAGDSYRMAEQYPAAVHAYRKGGYIDEMVGVITKHRNALDSDLLHRSTTVSRAYYFKVCPNTGLFADLSHSLYVAFKHQVST